MENKIREKALELGYEDCGVIKVGALASYREKLEERISRIPMGEKIYGRFRSYADPSADNLEIRSIIVAIVPTYRYNVPGEFDGVYGKAYMFDCRTDEKAPFFSIRKEFSAFLEPRSQMHVGWRSRNRGASPLGSVSGRARHHPPE